MIEDNYWETGTLGDGRVLVRRIRRSGQPDGIFFNEPSRKEYILGSGFCNDTGKNRSGKFPHIEEVKSIVWRAIDIEDAVLFASKFNVLGAPEEKVKRYRTAECARKDVDAAFYQYIVARLSSEV